MANLNPFLPAAEASVVRMRGRILACTILVTSGIAWFALWRGGSSPTARYSHAHIHFAAQTQAGLLLAFLAGWTLMLVAMMQPTSLPLLALFSRLTRERRDHWTLVGLVVAGYVAIWLLFGVAAYFATDPLVRIFGLEHWMHMHARWLAAGTVILAGSYQFTPLKYRCLEKCRSPFSFIAEHYRPRREKTSAMARRASRPVLRGMLLGLDAPDVHHRSGKHWMDACAGNGDGRGEEFAVGQPIRASAGFRVDADWNGSIARFVADWLS